MVIILISFLLVPQQNTEETSSRKMVTGVHWPDQDSDNVPISKTIIGSEAERAQKPSDVKKITAHKRNSSRKIKPIIKKNPVVSWNILKTFGNIENQSGINSV